MPRSLPAIAVVLVLALTACAPKHTNVANAAVASGHRAAATDPYAAGKRCYESPTAFPDSPMVNVPYPDWARAAFPPYPNASPTPCLPGIFEFRTSDDPVVVLAWYKARSKATWSRDVSNSWDGLSGDAEINVGPPPAPTNGLKTVIDVQALERSSRPKDGH